MDGDVDSFSSTDVGNNQWLAVDIQGTAESPIPILKASIKLGGKYHIIHQYNIVKDNRVFSVSINFQVFICADTLVIEALT